VFNRPEISYSISNETVEQVLKDIASPINHIARIIPNGASVLDIGAGNGLLSMVIKKLNKSVTIDGIEPNSYAASIAKVHYRRFFEGYTYQYLESIKSGNYDYVVMADVVEHTVDPYEFLLEVQSNISESTILMVSLPNIAFGGQRLALMNGHFNYVDSGLLEKTHLRFFTIESAKELFASVPLFPDNIIYLNRSFYRTEYSRKFLKGSLFQILKFSFIPNARAYQYLFILRKSDVKNVDVLMYGANSINILFDILFCRRIFKRFAKKVYATLSNK